LFIASSTTSSQILDEGDCDYAPILQTSDAPIFSLQKKTDTDVKKKKSTVK
jgi:hypothetical protein